MAPYPMFQLILLCFWSLILVGDAAPHLSVDSSVKSLDKRSVSTAWRQEASGWLCKDHCDDGDYMRSKYTVPTCLGAARSTATTPTAPYHYKTQPTTLYQYTVAIPVTTPTTESPSLNSYAPRAYTSKYDNSGLSDGANVGIDAAVNGAHEGSERIGARFGVSTAWKIGAAIGGIAGLVFATLGAVLCCKCCRGNRS